MKVLDGIRVIRKYFDAHMTTYAHPEMMEVYSRALHVIGCDGEAKSIQELIKRMDRLNLSVKGDRVTLG